MYARTMFTGTIDIRVRRDRNKNDTILLAHRHSTTEMTVSASRTTEATNNATVRPTEFVCDTTDVDVDVVTSSAG